VLNLKSDLINSSLVGLDQILVNKPMQIWDNNYQEWGRHRL